MGAEEFTSWRQFYIRWPFDDEHWYYRPAVLISTSFGGGDLNDRMAWLSPSFRGSAEQVGLSDAFGIPMR